MPWWGLPGGSAPNATFLPNAGTGFFSNGLPDSGLGLAGAVFFNERFKATGIVSDANGNRFDWGDITAGDFYTSLEFAYKIAPRTEKAGFSKFTIWHNDGTQDGQPINASTGSEGWGMTLKLEQELTGDGRAVGVLRLGKSWNDSAIFKQQVGLHFLYDNPSGPAGLKHDLIGVAGNWVESVVAGSRDEYNLEVFYRFPLFPSVDMRLSYQYVYHPALTREIDSASVFSLGTPDSLLTRTQRRPVGRQWSPGRWGLRDQGRISSLDTLDNILSWPMYEIGGAQTTLGSLLAAVVVAVATILVARFAKKSPAGLCAEASRIRGGCRTHVRPHTAIPRLDRWLRNLPASPWHTLDDSIRRYRVFRDRCRLRGKEYRGELHVRKRTATRTNDQARRPDRNRGAVVDRETGRVAHLGSNGPSMAKRYSCRTRWSHSRWLRIRPGMTV